METITIEEKIKTLILEEIKVSAIDACNNPTDDNICKLFNVVEYLKKILKNDSHTSPISTWQQSLSTPIEPLWGDNNVTARVRKSSDTGNDTFLAQKENSIPNDDDNIFNTYL